MEEQKKTISKYFFYLISVCYATEGIVDVVVGSAWPVIAESLKVDISLIGILVMVYYLGSIVTSPNTYKIRNQIGTNYTMVLSQILYAIALLLYLIAPNIYVFAAGMFINGIGCGLMEVNANSYVLKAYDVKEESFLSGFWGVGSIIGSTVMAIAVKFNPPYQRGFVILIAMLIVNIILLLLAKRSWKKQKLKLDKALVDIHSVTEEEKTAHAKITDLIKNKNVVIILLCFFLGHSVIVTLNSLVSTIAVNQAGIDEKDAVGITILFFTSIFLGRMLFGHFSSKISVIKVLKTNIMITILLFILLSISSFKGPLICVITILIGFVLSPIIPFLNAYIKELFHAKHLSALLGYADVSAIIGIITLSGLLTPIIKITSLQCLELVCAGILLVFYLLLVRTERDSDTFDTK